MALCKTVPTAKSLMTKEVMCEYKGKKRVIPDRIREACKVLTQEFHPRAIVKYHILVHWITKNKVFGESCKFVE